MISIKNELFECVKIRIELEFINKNKYTERYEYIKLLLKDNFSEISSKLIQENSSHKYFLKIYEKNNLENKFCNSNTESNCKIFISLNDDGKQAKIVSTFKNYIDSLQDLKKQKLTKLLFILDNPKEEENVKYISNLDNGFNFNDNISFLHSEKITPSEEEFLLNLSKIIFQLLKEFVYVFKQENEELIDKKNKNVTTLQNRGENYLLLGDYKQAQQCWATVYEMTKGDTISQNIAKESIALTLFLQDIMKTFNISSDLFDLKELKFNSEIESCFENSIIVNRKMKNLEATIESIYKLASYYILFETKLLQFHELMKKLYEEIKLLSPFQKLSCNLRMKNLYDYKQMNRKSIFLIYMAIEVCFENPELLNILPFIFKIINSKFYVNDIYNDKIENPEDFQKIHKKLIKNNWKKITFHTTSIFDNRKEMKETCKKRIDKDYKLYVNNRIDDIKKFILNSIWDPIQYNIYSNILNYYRNDLKMKLSYEMSNLQTLTNFISISDQTNLARLITYDSSLLQEKIFLNLLKLPVLIKIIPLSSDVKFDYIKTKSAKKNVQDAEEQVFLYNPWERDDVINYYWTAGSYQRVYIRFYNPLSMELKINKIVLLFEGNKPFSFPTSTVIQPNAIQGVICKLHPINKGITDIMGIKYEVYNTGAVQYVDWNGNGLFFGYENLSKDALSLSNNKKEKINLRSIKIFPQIPKLEIKVLDGSAKIINGSLDLYDYQFYQFSFLLENTGEYPVNEITVLIYAYKKDDYKISLDEIRLKSQDQNPLIDNNKNYILNYNYQHMRNFIKIEFKIYYSTQSKNLSDELVMKPYLYYIKSLDTLKLLNLSMLKVLPMLSNNMIHLITTTDPKINKDYSKFFCSDKYFVSFIIGNPHDDIIHFDIYSRDYLIKKEICEIKNTKEISLVIDSEMKMSEFSMNWEFQKLNNVKGKIDFSQIFKEFSFKFQNRIKFEINSSEEINDFGIRYFSIDYKLKNNSDKTFKNLKFYIYIYQVHEEDNIVFNNQLSDDVCYEGSLFYQITEFKELATYVYNLKIFSFENEHLSTTCLVVDQTNQIIYMSPISKSFYLAS